MLDCWHEANKRPSFKIRRFHAQSTAEQAAETLWRGVAGISSETGLTGVCPPANWKNQVDGVASGRVLRFPT